MTRPKSYHFIISNDFEYKKKDFFQDLFQSKYVYRLHESKFKPLHETTKIEDLISFKKLENKLEGELIVTIKVLTAKEVNIGARGALVLSLEEFKGTDTDQLIEEEEKKSLKKIAEVFNKQKKLTNKNGRFDPTTNPDDSKLLNIVEYILSYCENYLEENLSHKPKETIEFMRYKLFEIFDGENFFPHIQEVYSKTGFDFIEGLTNLKQKIIDFFKEEKNESRHFA